MFRGIGLWLLGVPIWLIIIILLFLRAEATQDDNKTETIGVNEEAELQAPPFAYPAARCCIGRSGHAVVFAGASISSDLPAGIGRAMR